MKCVIFALIFFLAFGCISPPVTPSGNVSPVVPQNVSLNVAFINTTNISEAHNVFGFDLLHLLISKSSRSNVLISPIGLSLALTMVGSGASGQTKNDILHALSISNVRDPDSKTFGLMSSLSSDHSFQLHVVNSLWLNNGLNINSNYESDTANYYNSQVRSMDFSHSDSAGILNNWFNSSTSGNIQTIVNPPLSGDVYLLNGVYFKGNWTNPFNPALTQEGHFILPEGSVETVSMMQQSDTFDYLETDQLQALRLPYGEGSMAMYVFLPKSGASGFQNMSDFVQQMNSTNWNSWSGSFSYENGTLLLPKFKISYGKELHKELTSLGMGSAFSDTANFSGITNQQVKLEQVIHKTYIQVDENGTESAATASLGMLAGPAPNGSTQTPHFEMDVTHPFLFAIVDKNSGEILFLGFVNDPKAIS